MDPSNLILPARWLHILSATVVVGVPIYLGLVLLPALAKLDEENRAKLMQASAVRWRILVYVCIAIFLATGLFNFLVIKRWADFPADQKGRYHMLFAVKFMLALVLFFLLSALAGRAAAFAYFRKNARTWIMVSILLGLAIIGISGVMRFMPFAPVSE